ncbi:MAG TPA: cob(I)yrinic acid a,c-diamide adenosyltransferase [Planctomycetota bacterium]|nr:cob(I)yrinic acid a,c-diamide adenosyltransferase [Planctomycetota bacterium]
MARIYTRKGDDGSTGLFDGTRVPKDHLRTEAYGDVDELSAVLGLARAFVEEPGIGAELPRIQRDLLAVGAQLADPRFESRKIKPKTVIDAARIEAFEQAMDRHDADLPPLKGFILRCGTKGASYLHLACTVCRRAERRIVTLSRRVSVPPIVMTYINRLSDLLFVLARVENKRGGEEQIDW